MLINIFTITILQYFKENPDNNTPKYNTKNGVYSEGCGLDNVLMSWGHDDYMYLEIISFLFSVNDYDLKELPKLII